MPRSILRALILGLTVGAVSLGGPASVSFAEDEEPAQGADPKAGESAPKTIEWVMGWAAGRERAKEDGRIIFLYFGRKKPG